MKFKEQGQRQDPNLDLSSRDDVHVGLNRCPFCHEDVEPKQSVVCQECLARHHEECWTEAQECSSCRGTRCMAVADDLETIEGEARAGRVGSRRARYWLSVMACLVLGAAFSLWNDSLLVEDAGSLALVGGVIAMAGAFLWLVLPSALKIADDLNPEVGFNPEAGDPEE